MPTQTVYPALLPLWQELQQEITDAQVQNFDRARLPRICFVGRFKTGKSRLINALVGSDVLPYNTDECTAQLVELVWGGVDKASRLDSLDLDSASEQPITVDQFQQAVDLTAMSNDRQRTAEAAAFRRYLTSHLLLTTRIVDTPGFDGANFEARRRADQVREHAIKQSDVCILILGKPLGEDDIECVSLIQRHDKELVVVLNKTDKCQDLQEALSGIQDRLADEIGKQPPLYACSAYWQTASEEERQKTIEWRSNYAEDEDETQWHQWDALVRCLSRPLDGKRHMALMSTIRKVYELAEVIQREYDPFQQAEATFLDHLPRWKQMMPPPLGPLILEMAVSAVQSGKLLPWKRLQNFDITPESFAPKSILPYDDLEALYRLYKEILAEAVPLCITSGSGRFFAFLLEDVTAFVDVTLCLHGTVPLEIKSKLSIAKITDLRDQAEKLQWFSQPLRTDFTYKDSLTSLQARWSKNPARLNEDCDHICMRLAAALV